MIENPLAVEVLAGQLPRGRPRRRRHHGPGALHLPAGGGGPPAGVSRPFLRAEIRKAGRSRSGRRASGVLRSAARGAPFARPSGGIMKMSSLVRPLVAAAVLAGGLEAQAQTPTWNGFYLGGQVGSAFLPDGADAFVTFDTNLDGAFGDTVMTAAGANAFSPGFCPGVPQGLTPAAGCVREDDGVDFGGRARVRLAVRQLRLRDRRRGLGARPHGQPDRLQHDTRVVHVHARAEDAGLAGPARRLRRQQGPRLRRRARSRTATSTAASPPRTASTRSCRRSTTAPGATARAAASSSASAG